MRAQRGRGADPAEQGVHRAVPQQVHVIDAVRARGHPGDQAPDFQVRIDAALAARRDVLRDQVAEPGALRQGHHRDQPGVRHEIRVVERCAGPREAMQQSHLQGVLSNRVLEASQLPSSQVRGHLFTLTRPNHLNYRWIEAKRRARPDRPAAPFPRARAGLHRPGPCGAHAAAPAPAPGLPRRRAAPPPCPPAHPAAEGPAAPAGRRAHQRPDRPPPWHIRGNRAHPPGEHLRQAARLQPHRRCHPCLPRPDRPALTAVREGVSWSSPSLQARDPFASGRRV